MSSDLKQLIKVSGKVVRDGAEVIVIFKVQGKYYPANDHNAEVMDTYIHTGDKALLNQFENEVEF